MANRIRELGSPMSPLPVALGLIFDRGDNASIEDDCLSPQEPQELVFQPQVTLFVSKSARPYFVCLFGCLKSLRQRHFSFSLFQDTSLQIHHVPFINQSIFLELIRLHSSLKKKYGEKTVLVHLGSSIKDALYFQNVALKCQQLTTERSYFKWPIYVVCNFNDCFEWTNLKDFFQ